MFIIFNVKTIALGCFKVCAIKRVGDIDYDSQKNRPFGIFNLQIIIEFLNFSVWDFKYGYIKSVTSKSNVDMVVLCDYTLI